MNHELPPVLRDHLDAVFAQAPDPANVVAAARLEIHTTPQQRDFLPRYTQRIPTMFSATKFIFAGAMVALVGSFILAGVLTQPSDVRVPAAASPTTRAATAEPEAAETEADTVTNTRDPLPGVDLVTREVDPGVYRVLSDGEHNLRDNVWDVTVASDGSVFVEKHAIGGPCFEFSAKNSRVLRLGSPGLAVADAKWDLPGVYREWGLNQRRSEVKDCERNVGPGLRFGTIRGLGPVMLQYQDTGDQPENATVLVFDGRDWIVATDRAVVTCGRGFEDSPSSVLIAADGACWTRPDSPRAESMGDDYAARIDASGERTVITPDDVGTEGGLAAARFAIDPAGRVMTGVHVAAGEDDGRVAFDGFASFDGEAWIHVPFTDAGTTNLTGALMEDLVVTPDGTVWAALGNQDETAIVSWDGVAWANHGYFRNPPRESGRPRLTVGPDGAVWLDGRHRFDDISVRTVELPGSRRDRAVAFAPDGSIWIADGGLYVVIPEAVAAAE